MINNPLKQPRPRKPKVVRPPPTKSRVRMVMAEAEMLDLPDGAYWAYIHDKLHLPYGDVFDIIAIDPEYFGYD